MAPIIMKEGYPFIGGCALLALILGWSVHPYVAVIPFVLMCYFTFFFRNPRRKLTLDKDAIVSPADGTVQAITELDADEFVKEPCVKVTIFMSIFDVHVNRSPMAGTIKLQKYFCGRFRPAYKDMVGFDNEHHVLGIENDRIAISVKQIAGVLARRIVSYVTLDDHMEQGELYGMIKFGSCLEVVMPRDKVEVTVKKGQKTRGGITVLGRIKN